MQHFKVLGETISYFILFIYLFIYYSNIKIGDWVHIILDYSYGFVNGDTSFLQLQITILILDDLCIWKKTQPKRCSCCGGETSLLWGLGNCFSLLFLCHAVKCCLTSHKSPHKEEGWRLGVHVLHFEPYTFVWHEINTTVSQQFVFTLKTWRQFIKTPLSLAVWI